MMTSKTHSYECCMCGDLGLSNELFRCKVCHFRSQHRYCSNLYPKAESYRVCNWCLIQKDNDHHETLATPTTTSYNNSYNSNCNSSSPETHSTKTTPSSAPGKKSSNNHHQIGPKSPKCLQPNSPIKKPIRSGNIGSPSGRKRITAQAQLAQQEEKMIRRTKSEEISNNNNNGSSSSRRISPSSNGPSSATAAAPAVIKHVFRNKVRRYKLLDEVSS